MKQIIVIAIVACNVLTANAAWQPRHLVRPARRVHRQPPPSPHPKHDDEKALAGGVLQDAGAVTGLVEHAVNSPETGVAPQPVVVPANNIVLRPVGESQPVMTVATPGEPALETVYIPATYVPPPPCVVKPVVIPICPLRPW